MQMDRNKMKIEEGVSMHLHAFKWPFKCQIVTDTKFCNASCIDILTDLGEAQKSCFQGSQKNVHNFRYSVATPPIESLIKEIKETFDGKEYLVLDTFHSFHPRNIPTPIDLLSEYGVENAKKIYSFYGQNRIDIYEGRCNEGSKLIKATQDCFLQQCVVGKRKEKGKSGINYIINLEVAEQKLL